MCRDTLITAVLPDLKLQAQKKDIQICFDYSQHPVYIALDTSKFSRAISNLLTNAIKFTPKGGKVLVSLVEQDDKVLLEINDNGIGIAEKLQDQIFDKFTKAARKGTEQETSTGLGLYIVKEIVALHEGKIWVESQENHGSSFFIELIKCQKAHLIDEQEK